jgi:hypothetical protein
MFLKNNDFWSSQRKNEENILLLRINGSFFSMAVSNEAEYFTSIDISLPITDVLNHFHEARFLSTAKMSYSLSTEKLLFSNIIFEHPVLSA